MGLMFRLLLLRHDLVVLWRAFWHRSTPLVWKGAIALAAVYVVSPIDLIPEIFGVFGIIDDLALIPIASRFIVSHLPPEIRAELAA